MGGFMKDMFFFKEKNKQVCLPKVRRVYSRRFKPFVELMSP